VETSTRKIRVGKAEGERSKRRSWEEEGREGQEEEAKKGEDNGSKESGRRMENMG